MLSSRKLSLSLSANVQCCGVWPVEICYWSLGQWRSDKVVRWKPYRCNIRATSILANQPLLDNENSRIATESRGCDMRLASDKQSEFKIVFYGCLIQIFYKTNPRSSCPCQGCNFSSLFRKYFEPKNILVQLESKTSVAVLTQKSTCLSRVLLQSPIIYDLLQSRSKIFYLPHKC